ncbi:MAG: nucleotidyltransferase family protein [Pseudomonadales bacterium]|jgi:MurNAc alpha-1-phosphate uridylyltransferase|nr:nucleotidyltransferase family protein [Pseudomonadales bacterium]
MKVMLLAAGKGTRMRELTQVTPKPLLRAGGHALIEHQIFKLRAAGFCDLVINHAWLGAQLEAALGDGAAYGVRIAWSREGEPLETAGGIARALPLLGHAPFLVVNADIWTDFDFSLLNGALGALDHAHLVLVNNPPQHPGGDFGLSVQGRLTLRPTAPAPAYTYSGIGVFRPALFTDLPRATYPLLPILEQCIKIGSASARLHHGEWQDIGTPERLAALDARLSERDERG